MKKKIGVFLSSRPNSGGAYQYSLAIINALESFNPDAYDLHCFYYDKDWEYQLSNRFGKTVIHQNAFNRTLSYLTRRFFHSTSIWRLAGKYLNSVKLVNASDCDVVIYPAQDSEAYQTDKKSIATIHDLMHRYERHFEEYTDSKCAMRDVHYSSTCRYSDLILVDSLVGKEQVLESYDVDNRKIAILPFVPPSYLLKSNFINVRDKYCLPEKFIFYPAQFWEHKNHTNLLIAVKNLKDRGIFIHLVLVGSKNINYAATMLKISQLDLSLNVSVLGYVTNDEMYSLYKSAVAMIFVSLIGPTNIPPMEALITGCPLICSNAYAMPEQVGEAALLVDPKSPNDIADKINVVWTSESIRTQLIENGRIQISKYGQDDFSKKLNNYVRQVVKL